MKVQVQALPLLFNLCCRWLRMSKVSFLLPAGFPSGRRWWAGGFLFCSREKVIKSPALKLPTRKATEEEHIWELPSVIIHHTTLPSWSRKLLTGIRVLLKSPLQAAGNASFPKFKLIISPLRLHCFSGFLFLWGGNLRPTVSLPLLQDQRGCRNRGIMLSSGLWYQ